MCGAIKQRCLAPAKNARLLSLPIALLLGFPLVGFALAFGESELELGAAALVEIDCERHQGNAFALDRAHQAVDLAAMQQELARPSRDMVEARGGILGEMRVDEVEVAFALDDIGLVDAVEPLPQYLYFGAAKLHARLERALDVVVVTRSPVLRDETLVSAERHLGRD